MNLIIPTDRSKYDAYVRHVTKYSNRSFSVRHDRYKAFLGILITLFGDDKAWYGIPLQHFECALRWEFFRPSAFEKDWDIKLYTDDAYCELQLPSWSWLPNMTEDTIVVNDCEYYCGTLSVWHAFDNVSNKLVAISCQDDHDIQDDWQLYMSIACNEGCSANQFTFTQGEPSWDDRVTRFDNKWGDYSSFHQDLSAIDLHIASSVLRIMQEIPALISARVASATFHVRPRRHIFHVFN